MNARGAQTRSRKNQKIAAIAATGLIVAAGATISSLAAWTDTEWVFGGAATENGVSTSVFEVNQNVTTGATWTNDLANPGGKIDFSIVAQDLMPGEPVYGFVRLRTIENSLPGDLTLNAPVMGAGGSATLFSALTYGAKIVPSTGDCTDAGFTASSTVVVAPGSATSAGSAVDVFDLAGGTAAPGPEKVVCFQLMLPSPASDTLQGLTAQPIWNFTAESKLP